MTTVTQTRERRSVKHRFLPILNWLPGYERAWLRGDILAGLTVLALLIPEGMAYAEIAGMPPQTAFYAAPIGLLLYAVFGTSRQLVVAVSAAIATMSAAAVAPLAAAGSPEYAALTAGLAILAGLVAILAGLLKLGRIAAFFSESVLAGFVTGLALTIAIKQVPKLFGFESGSGNFWERLYDILIHLEETHPLTLAIGIISIALLFFLEHRFHKLPAALIVMLLGIIFSSLFAFEQLGVHVVGEIPAGLAPPNLPGLSMDQWLLLLPGAFGLALVSALWAYDGWADVSYVAGEVEDPQRNLPRAIIGGTIAVMVIYVLANLGYMALLPIDEIRTSKLVAAGVAERVIGRPGVILVSATVMISGSARRTMRAT